jgi:hypothetical protein
MIPLFPTGRFSMMTRTFILALLLAIPLACDGNDDSDLRVGSRDCAVLDGGVSGLCTNCQGQTCGQDDCDFLPCVDGTIVVEGCNADEQCAPLSTTEQTIYCGMFTSPHSGLCGSIMGAR